MDEYLLLNRCEYYYPTEEGEIHDHNSPVVGYCVLDKTSVTETSLQTTNKGKNPMLW